MANTRPNSDNHSQQRLRLIASSNQPKVLTKALVRVLPFEKTIHFLIIMDVLCVTFMALLSSMYLPEITYLIYPANLILFFAFSGIFRLYVLTDNHYMVGKMSLLAFYFLGFQFFFFTANDITPANMMMPFALELLIFAGMFVYHHALSRPFSAANTKSLYYQIEQRFKRASDLMMASILMLCSLPILMFLSVSIWFIDRGPILFAQKRIGLNEQMFTMYKFRSMYLNAEVVLKNSLTQPSEEEPKLFKQKDDPRITPLGKIIRKLSVDELPQLFNVLKGNMSMVGPRPPLPNEFDQMTAKHKFKFKALPGITGLWQVTGRVHNERSFDAVSYYDTYYINDWCLMNDLAIVFQTIPVVFLQKGAF